MMHGQNNIKLQNLRLIPLPKIIENYILIKDTVGEIF